MFKILRSILPLYLIAAALAAIAIMASAIFSISRLNRQILETVRRNGEALVEMASGAAQNGFMASQILDELVAERLISIAGLVDRLPKIDHSMLLEIAALNELWAIDVLDRHGNVVISSRRNRRPLFPKDKIEPLVRGDEMATAFTLKMDHKELLVVVQKREKVDGFIAIYIETLRFSSFKKEIGIGMLIQRLAMNPEIVYLAFQDLNGILAATRNVRELSSIEADSFLMAAIKDTFAHTRTTEFEGQKVLEVVKSVMINGQFLGIFRLGMSLESVAATASAGKHQIILMSIILLVLTTALIGVAFLLHQYKAAQTAYKTLESSTEELLNSLPIGTLILDNNLKIRAANRRISEIFGFTGDIKGRSYSELFRNDEVGVLESKRSSQPVRKERIKHKFPDGRDGFITCKAVPMTHKEGEGVDFVALVEDISHEVETESKLRRIRDLELIAELVSTLAHDIINPLNSISLMAQKIARKGGAEVSETAQKIREEVSRIDRRLKEFIQLSAPIRLHRQSVRIDWLLKEVAKSFETECEQRSIEVKLDVQPVEIAIDIDKFRQALENLVRNAIEAMPNGGILTLRCRSDNKEVIIEVSDTGVGIPKEALDKIFKPFYTTKPGGTGLGLAQVERTVMAHSGKIEVTSEPGKGTTFRIRIPK